MSADSSTDNQEILTTSDYAHWLCLLEALDAINAHATRLSVNLNSTDWVKPLAIQRYMSERLPAMKTLISKELTTCQA